MIELDIKALIFNQFFLLLVSVLLGLLLGRIQYKQIKLGISGTLFTGIFFGWLTTFLIMNNSLDQESINFLAQRSAEAEIVDESLFNLFLIIFSASVGLLAAKDMGLVIKKFGIKFSILGFAVTLTGALVCYLSTFIFKDADPYALAGVFTGALTSSPGLGAALESVSSAGYAAQEAVAAGHAAAYPIGVIIVVLAVNLIPKIFSMDMSREFEKLEKEISSNEKSQEDLDEASEKGKFHLLEFTGVCLLGQLLGSVKIYIGPLGFLNLGLTGGVLISSLALGYIGKIGPFQFRMDEKILTALRQISLAFFLSVVGLNYGYAAVNTFIAGSTPLIATAFLSGTLALAVGFIIGRYLFKLNWILLSGALCGGMTSTPGLGAAIDSIQSDKAAMGYGATYPVALFFMVFFSILLHKLPLPH
ncbi:MAG TPA: hypothetical protein DEA47_02760 [Peptococcaceae bacterium]|nr:MAG: Uncharacterized protein XD50_0006 [Clostridia bacterium 41_269]HBT20279.1 hypothetical protein [Peptococcaceae bacterium]